MLINRFNTQLIIALLASIFIQDSISYQARVNQSSNWLLNVIGICSKATLRYHKLSMNKWSLVYNKKFYWHFIIVFSQIFRAADMADITDEMVSPNPINVLCDSTMNRTECVMKL